jgi:putative SOS response-associated peptidase YedK
MCGRFTQHHDTAEIEARFGAQAVLFDPGPRYNIAPSQPIAVVVTEASTRERIVDGFQWGLVPLWAKDPAVGNKMINARSETVAEKPAFKNALKKRRCILPADGFYEWDKIGGTRQPYHFHRRDGKLFGFAGLWEEWKRPESDSPPLYTCTILTTQANATVGQIHERMPVILQSPDDEALWLDTEMQEVGELLPLFAPYPDAEMEAFAVSKRINTPAIDDPELLSHATANSA